MLLLITRQSSFLGYKMGRLEICSVTPSSNSWVGCPKTCSIILVFMWKKSGGILIRSGSLSFGVYGRVPFPRLMSQLANSWFPDTLCMFWTNQICFKRGQVLLLMMEASVTFTLFPCLTKGKHCLKSPPRRRTLPPFGNLFFIVVWSNSLIASRARINFMVASSEIIISALLISCAA